MATVSEQFTFESTSPNTSCTTSLKLSGNWTCFFNTLVECDGSRGALFVASKSEWENGKADEIVKLLTRHGVLPKAYAVLTSIFGCRAFRAVN